jgi:hypothetical protein
VKATRCQLDELRREKWGKILDDVHKFCDKNDICKLKMEDEYIDPKKRRHKSGITNNHYYQVDCFNDVIERLLQELDSRFSETSSLNCFFAQPLLVQETHFMILIWKK